MRTTYPDARVGVVDYDKNSWNFTPLGKLESITKAELKALLGKGNVTAILKNAE